jgi:hypothetical protein
VIAESAGSLAELGAFTSNDTIRESLRVVIPRHHETDESFVRYGPIQRLKNERREKLGVYPWTVHAKGGLNVSSVKPHYRSLVSFIKGHLDAAPHSTLYRKLDESTLFYVVYWIIHLSTAITPKLLYECVRSIGCSRGAKENPFGPKARFAGGNCGERTPAMSLVIELIEAIGLSGNDIERVIHTAPARYKVYPIEKRSGGHRIIAQPSRELKAIQRYILARLCTFRWRSTGLAPFAGCALAGYFVVPGLAGSVD